MVEGLSKGERVIAKISNIEHCCVIFRPEIRLHKIRRNYMREAEEVSNFAEYLSGNTKFSEPDCETFETALAMVTETPQIYPCNYSNLQSIHVMLHTIVQQQPEFLS